MMKDQEDRFRTRVSIPDPVFRLSYQTATMLMGSCFTASVGENMVRYKFPARYNPFGVLYNPASVSAGLRLLMEGRRFTGEDLVFHDGLWVSLDHHSAFSHRDRDTCLENINRSLEESARFLQKCDYLFLTFGTSWIYEYRNSGKVAANCHKIPSAEFDRKLLQTAEIVADYRRLMQELEAFHPGLRVIFTVSPVRHLKDGFFSNQVSKSMLLLSVHQLLEDHAQMHYFPAYEIFMDELRDYRFYADDMLHPSAAGVDYVWDRFCETYFGEEAKKTMAGVERIQKAVNHRPFQAESTAYLTFVDNTLRQMDALQKNFPFLDFSPEKSRLSALKKDIR